jgi:23S rRNA pseudouridine2605 synthase
VNASEASPGAAKGERIAKVLARAGIASRREAEKMIAAGRVSVDGRAISSPALNVTPANRIGVDGKPLKAAEPARMWLYHKPPGLVTSHRDPQGRPTVFTRLSPGLPRVVSVGRLDMPSEGLLLLTNDGALARSLELPARGWIRRYRVRVFGRPDEPALANLKGGVSIEGVDYGPIDAALERQKGDNCWLTLALREGKNREVRRVMEHLGCRVNRLIRVAFGPFQLGNLEAGEVREVPRKVLKEQLGEGAAPPSRSRAAHRR